MKQDEDLWLKKMRERLGDYSEAPPSDGWEQLEKQLRPAAVKRISPYTWWAAAAAALVLAVSGVSLFFLDTPTAHEVQYAVVPTAPGTKPGKVVPGEQKVVSGEQEALAHVGQRSKHTTVPTVPANKTLEKADEPEIAVSPQPEEEVPVISVQEAISVQEDTHERKTVKPSAKDKLHIPVETEKKTSSRGKWSIAASVGNATSSTNGSGGPDYPYKPSGMVQLSASDGLTNGDVISIPEGQGLVFSNGVAYLSTQEYPKEFDHKLPVSFGLSVRKNLSNGFSVETGLMYTLLSSEAKNGTSSTLEQKLNYIGIPVRGNWNFVDSKRFTLYLSAGGMVEKCVYGKLDGNKLDVKPLQFSVAGGLGAQFNASKYVGVYVEPGVSYYFDDGSDVNTIRKETPFNFNLQVGIRLTY